MPTTTTTVYSGDGSNCNDGASERYDAVSRHEITSRSTLESVHAKEVNRARNQGPTFTAATSSSFTD